MQPRIAFLNPNTNKKTTLMLTDICNAVAAGQAVFEGHTMLTGPQIIADETALSAAGRQIVAIGQNIAVHGADGLLGSAILDCRTFASACGFL